MLFDKFWSRKESDAAVRAFQRDHDNLSVGWALRREDSWRRIIFSLREVRSFASYLARKGQSRFYLNRWESYLTWRAQRVVRLPVVRRLLANRVAQAGLRLTETLVPSDSDIRLSLQEMNPDVVVAAPVNLRFSEEIEYVKAAQALKIPTVVPVYSWDNLTTKGLYHVIPDLLLAWNQTQLHEAVEIHHVPRERIIVTGSPFFDKWFETEQLAVSREAFCSQVGLDPSEPFIAYLGSSGNIARDEGWLVEALANRLRAHANPALHRATLLVRPHPANAKVYAKLTAANVRVWPAAGELAQSHNGVRDFYNTMVHAAAIVGINTSGMIDAVLVDKPCTTILLPEYRATQEQAIHFRYLLESKVLDVAADLEAWTDLVERHMQGDDDGHMRRRRFAEAYIRPRGLERNAGATIGAAIEMAARGASASDINYALDGLQARSATPL